MFDAQIGLRKNSVGLLGVRLGHDEVDVVVGLGASARPGGVPAPERERDAGFLERDGGAFQGLAQRVLLVITHGASSFPQGGQDRRAMSRVPQG